MASMEDFLARFLPESTGNVDVSQEELPTLLARLAALQVALIARLPEISAQETGEKAMPLEDRLLTVEEAAEKLGVIPRWLYRNKGNLPFTRQLSRKKLRFSEAGLKKWIASRRP